MGNDSLKANVNHLVVGSQQTVSITIATFQRVIIEPARPDHRGAVRRQQAGQGRGHAVTFRGAAAAHRRAGGATPQHVLRARGAALPLELWTPERRGERAPFSLGLAVLACRENKAQNVSLDRIVRGRYIV